MKNKGFTLIELLISISIIAILSIIGIVAYSSFMQTARNNKRQSDLKLIQSALEDYHADQLSYPSSLSVLTSGTRIYMNQVPNDPKSSPYPDYSYAVSGTGYCLYACFEGSNKLGNDQNCTSMENCPTERIYGITRP